MTHREEIIVSRDVEAVVIPAGDRILIPEGVPVTLTQSLGGSYTVITPQGYMARVAGKDADALGKPVVEESPEPAAAPGAPVTADALQEQIWDQLRQVYDPEIPINIVDLGLVYTCEVLPVEGGYRVSLGMTMTAPGCGMGDVLKADAEERIRSLAGVKDVQAEIVWDPPWDQSRMSEAARLELGFG
jgi:probable FeS assembly SUF system protein SufT